MLSGFRHSTVFQHKNAITPYNISQSMGNQENRSAGRHKESFVETPRDTRMEEPGHMEDLQDQRGEREDTVEEGGEKHE